MALKEEQEITDLLEAILNHRSVNDKYGLFYKGKIVRIGGKALYKSEKTVRMILKNNIYMRNLTKEQQKEYDKAIDELIISGVIEIKPV